ncbi:PREDICTED: flavanone 3-dioxygenase-like [Nelumbo nucifera]|uniref:Fe2OG dioxygenase domain-containing protein n=2 Tax=Nelumbo nucifera TaxID=4432 RepID=A0A822XY13_NELNU|nr:PREDICTED: flavanone 3-dioxygenase-like [Nelumbo nucifera]DAD24603.1 TPA_asm: hypothetical protein HUJ06_026067 [Nelumbo nucifera]
MTFAPLTALVEEKTLPQSFIRIEDDRPKVAYNQFSNEIPVISLAGIMGESESQREEISKKIVEACEEWGMFQVIDHGVEEDLISEMYRLSREFFSLSDDEKLQFDMTGGKKGGYLVSSHLQGEAFHDWREFFTFFTYPVESRDYSRWPDKPEGWRKVTESYTKKMMDVACKLMEVLSEAMGLEKEALAKACINVNQKLLTNFYPKCPQPELALGVKRHTDPSTIVLLVQDQVGGLQATRDGGKTWVTVQPIQGALVVNIGDHGYFLSNGRFKSADHQVAVNSSYSRLSIATFHNPTPEAIVYPLKIRQGEKAVLDEPITFTEMYRRKFANELAVGWNKKIPSKEQQQLQQEPEKPNLHQLQQETKLKRPEEIFV